MRGLTAGMPGEDAPPVLRSKPRSVMTAPLPRTHARDALGDAGIDRLSETGPFHQWIKGLRPIVQFRDVRGMGVE